MDRTGIAHGTLRPCIYFVRASDGYAILAPLEVGGGVELARKVFGLRYRNGWSWCEATTLNEVDKLQKKLADQDIREANKRVECNSMVREKIYRETGSILRQHMVSSSTSAWERDFIQAYLNLRDEKRDKYRDALLHHNSYIFAREYDEGKNVDELLPLLPGQFERSGT